MKLAHSKDSLTVGHKYASMALAFFITLFYLADTLAIEGSLTKRLKTVPRELRKGILMSHSFRIVVLVKKECCGINSS